MDPDVVVVSDMIEHLLIGDFTPLKMHQTWLSPWPGWSSTPEVQSGNIKLTGRSFQEYIH